MSLANLWFAISLEFIYNMHVCVSVRLKMIHTDLYRYSSLATSATEDSPEHRRKLGGFTMFHSCGYKEQLEGESSYTVA